MQDVLARRTRALLLDARASIEAAPRVALLLVDALGRDSAWQARELTAFTAFTLGHLPVRRTRPAAHRRGLKINRRFRV